MGYHVVDPASVEPTPDRPCARRAVGDAAGLENVALGRSCWAHRPRTTCTPTTPNQNHE